MEFLGIVGAQGGGSGLIGEVKYCVNYGNVVSTAQGAAGILREVV